MFHLFTVEGSERLYSPEMETNEIERQQPRVQDTSQNRLRSHASVTDDSERNEVISKQQMCKKISFVKSDMGSQIP